MNSSKTIPTCDRFSYKKSLTELMIQMMKPSILPPLPQSPSHKNMMIIRIHRTHMTCDYDKDRQESHGSWHKAKVKTLQKSLQGAIGPWQKQRPFFLTKIFYFAKIRQNCRQARQVTIHLQHRQVTIHEQWQRTKFSKSSTRQISYFLTNAAPLST